MLWESAGSPLNIRRIVDYLIAHGYLQWQPTGWIADMERIRALRIPGGAASILMEKSRGACADEPRAHPEAAAVFGEIVERRPPDAASPTSRRRRRTPRCASSSRIGLLDESNDGKTITFPQMHLRDAVYNAMTERRRTELHSRVGEALEPALRARLDAAHRPDRLSLRARERDREGDALLRRGGRSGHAHAGARGGDGVLSRAPSS